jgi:hypothetical protein
MKKTDRDTSSSSLSLGRTEHRPYWVLLCSVAVRAAHQIGAAVFLTSFLFTGMVIPAGNYTWLAVISGFVLLATEGMRHREMYREVSGVATGIKCVLIALAVHGLLPGTPLIITAFILASLAAHAPKNIRHKLLY